MSLENLPPTVPELAIQLRKFGLTQYQSSALAAVIKGRRISATDISRQANVPITKIYGTLGELEVRGYVTEELGRPKYYSSPEPQAVLGLIIKSHEQQLRTIKECSKQTLSLLKAEIPRQR